ncbi:MAG: carbohydrate porin [Terriglobales bacterium]
MSSAQTNPVNSSLETLNRNGVNVSLDLTSDSFFVAARDLSQHGTAQAWLDLSAEIQLRKVAPSFSRTRAFFSLHSNGIWNSGLGGAGQSLSGIQSEPGVHLAEFWLEQSLAAGVQLRAGKIDANRDFAYIENASVFLNTVAGYNPTFVALPNYNVTHPGAELLLHGRNLRLNVAAFAPVQGTGTLFMQEAGVSWSPTRYPGRVAVGTWQSTGSMPTLEGNLQRGGRGAYFVAEQYLWCNQRSAHNQQSLAAYFQYGSAPTEFSTFIRLAGGGLVWKAPIARRSNDAAGASVSRGHFSSVAASYLAHTHETALEAFYRVQISSRLSISPDLQYIANPGGAAHNLCAVGARMNLSLIPRSE